MPVIPMIDQAIKLGNDMTPMVPGIAVAGIKTAGQVALSASAMQIMGTISIPVLPVGAAAALGMSLIEYIVNLFKEESAKQFKKVMDDYNNALKRALAAQAAAVKKLQADEIKAQKILQKELIAAQARSDAIPKIITTETQRQVNERAKYNKTLFQYSFNALEAKNKSDLSTAQHWADQIAGLSDWIVAIFQISADIIMLQIEQRTLNLRIAQLKPLCQINIAPPWAALLKHADDFQVAVPYYPDLPSLPSPPLSLPELPSNCLMDKGRQMLAKWIVAPQLLPMGQIVGTLLECARATMAPLPPPIAAQMEAAANSLMMQLGLAV